MRWILGLIGVFVLLGLAAFLVRTPAESVSAPPARGCLGCHADGRESPGGIHAALGDCEICHLGDRGATTAAAAHRGLELEPGALDTADRTCGRGGCHPGQVDRVRGSLMATARGLIAVDAWAFGELEAPTSTLTAHDLLTRADPSPAQDHLRKLCLGCHLGTRRDNRDDMLAGTTSGCSACHMAAHRGASRPHPVMDRAPPDQRCFGCHSRSGRISLSYQGWAEVRGTDLEACASPIPLADGRHVCRQQPDLHKAAGLACVDCHLHTELMGDGGSYAHEEDQVEVRCESCHGPAEGLTTTWGEVVDATSRRLLALNDRPEVSEASVRTGRRRTPLWNVTSSTRGWTLHSKLGARDRPIPQTPRDPSHQLPGHGNLTCATCHTAWTPTCPTCHTGYAPKEEQWDFGRAAVVGGRWSEAAERYLVAPPVLARRGERVVVAAPGMIATLDARAAGGPHVTGRWFAAFDPHTTQRAGRTCAGCHLDPRALGLGTGTLTLRPQPRFLPADGSRPNSPNSDGWQGLFPPTPGQGTRPEVRGLDARTQWRVLRVGACLSCHPKPEDAVYADFEDSVRRLGRKKARSCRGWDRPWLHRLPPRIGGSTD